MRMTHYTLGTLATLVLALGVALPTFAQSVDLNADMRVETDVLEATQETSVEAEATAGEQTSAEEGSDRTSSETEAQTTFSLTRSGLADIDTSASVSAETVTSGEDLRLYAASLMAEDDRFVRIDAAGEDLSLTHAYQVKLLGFIPWTMHLRTTVAADGSVSISYPWYRFMVTGIDDTRMQDVETRVEAAIASETASTTSASSSAHIRASALRALQGALMIETSARMHQEGSLLSAKTQAHGVAAVSR